MRIPHGLRSALASQAAASTTDQYFSDVSLLLYGDGTNGSTAIVDSSSNNHAITVNGDAQISTTQSKFGGSSVYFDGSGDYLTVSNNVDLQFGTGDFTIEGWFYVFSQDKNYLSLFSLGSFVSGILLRRQTPGSDRLYINGTAYNYDQTFFPASTWVHIALTRQSGSINLWIDGTSRLSATNTSSISPTLDLYIGTAQHALADVWNGYIDDLRITKGVARYTANFTPPTASFSTLTPGEPYFYNTSLLLSADGSNGSTAIVDSSANAHTITVNGDAQISTTQSKFGGSSLFLDGTGDYLLINSQMSTFEFPGDFTIEGWFWFNQNNVGYQGLLGSGVNADQTGFVLITETNNTITFIGSSNTSWNTILATTTVPTTNTWHHIAVCRSGSAVTMYLNGTSIGSTTSSNFIRSGSSLRVGGYQYFPGGERSFNGYIDDLRITKGVARYTANFTPPTSAFPDL